jgi:hypothetical protein
MKKILLKLLTIAVLASFISISIDTVKAASYQTRIKRIDQRFIKHICRKYIHCNVKHD